MAAPAASGPVAEYIALLAQVPFLSAATHEDLDQIAQSAVVRRVAATKHVVNQGEFGHSMFVLLSGVLSIHAYGDDGNYLALGQLERPGDFFGEVALLGRGVRSATVRADNDAVLLEIEKRRFELITRRNEAVYQGLEKWYHVRSIATYTRLHRYLGSLPEDTIREVTAGAVMRKFGKNDTVTKAGDPADTILLVKDGVLKMVRSGGDGRLSILAYFNTHDVAGSHDASTRVYDLVALGQAEVIFLPRGPFMRLATTHPEIFSRFSKDDMHRQEALADAGKTVFGAAQAFLQEGVEVESLLVINLDRCVRCGNCVRACHSRHEFTRLDRRGPIFRRRKAIKSKRHEHLMIPSSCRHCRDPECMIGCPTGAIQRFPNGDVDINDNCIGCDNCARKCPYGNITMRPLPEKQQKDGVVKRAIKCNLCRGYSYSNCVHECPRGAVLRVDPLRYFDELALVMESEQIGALEWQQQAAIVSGKSKEKHAVKPRSTLFIWLSLVFFFAGCAAITALYAMSPAPRSGGTEMGLTFGIASATCIAIALFLGARKRLRNLPIGKLEVWTQWHMVIGVIGFFLCLAHAGFRITGVFTTILLLVFATEIVTGVLGQAIYMIVPRILTRLERSGLSKLIEDLLTEELELEKGMAEIATKAPPEIKKWTKGPLARQVGPVALRYRKAYDPEKHPNWVRKHVAVNQLPDKSRDIAERMITDACRLQDVRAQLRLHRMMKSWLILHIATAGALATFLIGHIASMLLMVL